jgi:hypothetical protein
MILGIFLITDRPPMVLRVVSGVFANPEGKARDILPILLKMFTVVNTEMIILT